MPKYKYENKCERCGEDNNELYNRAEERPLHAYTWVCKKCYEPTFGFSWRIDFGGKSDKKRVQVERGN